MEELPAVWTPTSVTVTFNEPVVPFKWAPPGKSGKRSHLRLVAVDGELVDDVNNKE